MRIARELGYLNVPNDALLSVDQIDQFPAQQLVLICTGSQGEPTSALVRMGQQNLRSISIVPGDTVIISATPIPGNEELVNRTLDNLFRLGANVYYDEVLDVHVSGHASQEEQKLLINLIRPQYFVPIHGEYRHLVLHAQLAQQCGLDPSRVFVMETGDVLEIDEECAEVVDGAMADNYVFVDGRGVGDVGQGVLDDRRLLSRNGFLVAVVALDKYTGSVVGEPQIITRGFVFEAEASELFDMMKSEITKDAQRGGTRTELAERLKNSLARLAFEETGRRPVIVPVISKL